MDSLIIDYPINNYIPTAGEVCEMRSGSYGDWTMVEIEAYSNENGKATGFINGRRFAMFTKYCQFRKLGE